MTPKVVLLLRIRTRDGKRTYVRPVVNGSQHLRALWGIVNNTPEHHPEGTYYLRYTVANGRRAWEPVGYEGDYTGRRQSNSDFEQ